MYTIFNGIIFRYFSNPISHPRQMKKRPEAAFFLSYMVFQSVVDRGGVSGAAAVSPGDGLADDGVRQDGLAVADGVGILVAAGVFPGDGILDDGVCCATVDLFHIFQAQALHHAHVFPPRGPCRVQFLF